MGRVGVVLIKTFIGGLPLVLGVFVAACVSHLLLELGFEFLLLRFGHAVGVDATQNGAAFLVGCLFVFFVSPQLLHILSLDVPVHVADLAAVADLLKLLASEGNDYVLRLQICVDNLAVSVQVVQANQDLLCHAPDDGNGDPLVVIAFHYLEQINAQNFKDHDKVGSVRPRVQERIEQLHCVAIFN